MYFTKRNHLLLAFIFSLLFSCTSDTYKIITTENSNSSSSNPEETFKEVTTILINVKTGETWELIHEEEWVESTYKWIKLKKENKILCE